jgi:hypothetical protein
LSSDLFSAIIVAGGRSWMGAVLKCSHTPRHKAVVK